MKRLISLSLFLSSALCSHAQDVNKTLTLDEVTVQAAKVVNKADGLLIYPTNAQKQGSTMASASSRSSRFPTFALTMSTMPSRLLTTGARFN